MFFCVRQRHAEGVMRLARPQPGLLQGDELPGGLVIYLQQVTVHHEEACKS
jgi:hypothetical protein